MTSHADHERLRIAISAALAPLGTELYDLELARAGQATILRVLVDRDGGVDLDAITEATRAIDPVLEAQDPVAGRYTLEVSSPGLERPLRRPEHFARSRGLVVSVKTSTPVDGQRRHQGIVHAVDDRAIELLVTGTTGPRRIELADIASAHTVFEWGPAPKPTGGSAPRGSRAPAARSSADPTSTPRTGPHDPVPSSNPRGR